MASPAGDRWLVEWLDAVEPSGETTVTLFVNGMVISGQVISPMAYFRSLSEEITQGVTDTGGEGGARFRDYFDQLAELSAESLKRSAEQVERLLEDMPPFEERTPEQDELLDRLGRNYIHLRNAVAIMGGNMRINTGLWRGRLSEVTGWSLGIPAS